MKQIKKNGGITNWRTIAKTGFTGFIKLQDYTYTSRIFLLNGTLTNEFAWHWRVPAVNKTEEYFYFELFDVKRDCLVDYNLLYS